MKNQLKLVFAFAAIQLTTLCTAWSINGHLYVANIAERLLEENSPSALESAYGLLDKLTEFDPEFTWREQDHALVECSTFADDWKYRGEAWQGYFHYVNIPWVDDDSGAEFDIRYKYKNITDGTIQIVNWLSGKNGDGYKDEFIYEYLMNKYEGNEDVAKSYALRMLVHFVGDIVQPLHSMNRYSTEYPKGDKGATQFKLPYRYTVKHLHALWDKVMYEERKNIRRPFSAETWDAFQVKVTDVMAKYGGAVADPSSYESTDIGAWCDEGFEMAKGLYDGVTAYEPVPQEYLDKNIPVAYEQIVLGGYRLYYLIDYIFTP